MLSYLEEKEAIIVQQLQASQSDEREAKQKLVEVILSTAKNRRVRVKGTDELPSKRNSNLANHHSYGGLSEDLRPKAADEEMRLSKNGVFNFEPPSN